MCVCVCVCIYIYMIYTLSHRVMFEISKQKKKNN